MEDNPNLTKDGLAALRKDAEWRRERFGQWPETVRQCMTRNLMGVVRRERCPNPATFTVGFHNGEAQDVCRACLIVVCEMAKEEVVVMKLRSR